MKKKHQKLSHYQQPEHNGKKMQNNFSRTCILCLTRSLGAKNAIDIDFNPAEIDAQAFRVQEQDLFMCERCWDEQFRLSLQEKMFLCHRCSLWFEIAEDDKLHPARVSLNNHTCHIFNVRSNFGPIHFQSENSMLYIHYEVMQISPDLVAASDGALEPEMIKLKFTSSDVNCVLNFKRDGLIMNQLIHLIKQIPASHRTFDPIDYIWTIPSSKFNVLRMLVIAQHTGHQFSHQHPDLHAFIYPPKVEEKTWADQIKDRHTFKTEAAEDFFRNIPAENLVLDQSTLESKLQSLMSQYISISELKAGDRTSFMRAYKLTARRLHPDLGGDATKMSELNELFTQWKEVVK